MDRAPQGQRSTSGIRLLEENRDILDAIAVELLEKETIILDDMDKIIRRLREEPADETAGEVAAAAEA